MKWKSTKRKYLLASLGALVAIAVLLLLIASLQREENAATDNPQGSAAEQRLAFLEALDKSGIDSYDSERCVQMEFPSLVGTPYTLYKFTDTFASFVFYQGVVYPLGEHFGGYGVMDALPYEDGLLFTFSWGSGMHRSHIGWFDANTCTQGVAEYVYFGGDMLLEAGEEGRFALYSAQAASADDSAIQLQKGTKLGTLTYTDEKFHFLEE